MKTIVKPFVAALLAMLSAAAFAVVDVNKASQAELEAVKGIGPSMAGRILEARKAGAFKDWSDLQSRVKGVRNGNSAKFSADGLTVSGAEFKPVATEAAATRNAKAPKTAKVDKTDAGTAKK
jgi:competence protein ComEA